MRRTLPVIVLLAASACSTAPQPANTNTTAVKNTPVVAPVDPNAPEPATAAALVEAHAADPAAFKQKYLGRDVELSGTVESIVMDPKDADHVLGLRLVAETKADPKGTLLCSFPEQKKVKKADLKIAAGGPVKFKASLIGNAAGLEFRITTLY